MLDTNIRINFKNHFNMIKRLLVYTLIILLIVPVFSCGRSRRRSGDANAVERVESNRSDRRQSRSTRGKIVVKMRKEGGVYHIPCKINGTEMEFVFDTGASDITMSLTEALFLEKQGKLTDDDFTGTQRYELADGSIIEGATVNLRTVEIGGRILHNIQASITNNMEASLLLGQSVLSEFGKVSIDYKRNEITFE
jgi:aspartyl protease family protein